SYRIVPANGAPSKASVEDTSNSLGLHDTLRYGPRSLANDIKGRSVLQQRLEQWEETQDQLKLTLQRNLYGLHLPVRQMMERKIVSASPHMPAMAQFHSNVHLDILMGRDEALDVADFFGGKSLNLIMLYSITELGSVDECTGLPLDIHSEMERKKGI
ncbi:proteasome maturation factor UMP1, partial [Hysterangium stoloniferum]